MLGNDIDIKKLADEEASMLPSRAVSSMFAVSSSFLVRARDLILR